MLRHRADRITPPQLRAPASPPERDAATARGSLFSLRVCAARVRGARSAGVVCARSARPARGGQPGRVDLRGCGCVLYSTEQAGHILYECAAQHKPSVGYLFVCIAEGMVL